MIKNLKRISIMFFTLIMLFSQVSCMKGQTNENTSDKEKTTINEEVIKKVKTVSVENIDLHTDLYEAKGKVIAKDNQNNVVWAFESDAYRMTELDLVSDVAERADKIFVIINSILYCFDKESGNILWQTAECGAPKKIVFIDDNRLAFTGYYGPNLMIIKFDDNGIREKKKLDVYSNLCWGYNIEVVGNRLKIDYGLLENRDVSNTYIKISKDDHDMDKYTVYTDFDGRPLEN